MKRNIRILFILAVILVGIFALASTAHAASGLTVEVYSSSYTFTGSEIEPSITVRYNGSYVYSNYYKAVYYNNKNVGTGTVTVSYKGETATDTFSIEPKNIYSASFTMDNVTYSETPVIPTGVGKYNGYTLVAGVDYEVSPFNCSTSSRVDIIGKGNFTGSTYAYVSIKAKPLSECTVRIADQKYTGNALKPSVTVYNGSSVVPASNYEVTYSNNINPGYASVRISSRSSNYSGSTTGSFRIRYDIGMCNISISKVTYTGSPLTPEVRISRGNIALKDVVDYSVSSLNNVNAGTGKITITGNGIYMGTVTKDFTILPKPITTATVTFLDTETKYVYTGEEFSPEVKVDDGTKALVKDKDYQVTYNKNIKPGYGQVVVMGLNNYGDKKISKFNIYPAKHSVDKVSSGTGTSLVASWDKGPDTCRYKVYRNGKLIGTTKTKAIKYTDKASKTNGKKYAYAIQAVAKDSDDLVGEMSEEVSYMYLKAPTVKVVTSGSRQLKASWTKNSKATGYELQYSTSSKFTNKKTIKIKDKKTLSKTISKLTVGKKYYFRVRAYAEVEEVVTVVQENKEELKPQTSATETATAATAATTTTTTATTTTTTATTAPVTNTEDATAETEAKTETEVKTKTVVKKYYSPWSKVASKVPITAKVQSSAI